MKRCLLLTYYFPPCGGAGVQRWVRFLRYLPENGWLPTVITTKNGDYPVIDESLLQTIPPEIEIIRTHTPSYKKLFQAFAGRKASIPYGDFSTDKSDSPLKKLAFLMRLHLVAPDMRITWNPHLYRAALQELRTRRYDCIVTSAPPYSTHLVGMKLRKRFGIPWLADFRDPWTKVFYLQQQKQNPLIRWINRSMERKVLANADLNLVITNYIADELPAGNKRVLYNGYDHKDFEGSEYHAQEKFRVKYIGKVTQGQDVSVAVEALRELRDGGMDKIEMVFVGTWKAGEEPYRYDFVRSLPQMPHEQAVGQIVDAEALLLLINQYAGSKGMLTTKLFEYIGSGTPIVSLGDTTGEAAQVLRDYDAGKMIDYRNVEAFKNEIGRLYRAWNGSNAIRNRNNTAALSAKEQTKQLAEALNSITLPL